MDPKEIIARRAAQELVDGEVVNLGFGIPTAVANYLPEGVEVMLQSENGCLVFGATPKLGHEDPDLANAGGAPITLDTGASVFNLDVSFLIIRGGHVGTTILGGLEVDQEGNISNWATPVGPGKWAPGMGGAMDLVTGARKVIATLIHTQKGAPKILKKCSLPITGKGVVNTIISEMALFDVTPSGLVLREVAPGVSVDDVRKATEADFSVSPELKEFSL